MTMKPFFCKLLIEDRKQARPFKKQVLKPREQQIFMAELPDGLRKYETPILMQAGRIRMASDAKGGGWIPKGFDGHSWTWASKGIQFCMFFEVQYMNGPNKVTPKRPQKAGPFVTFGMWQG